MGNLLAGWMVPSRVWRIYYKYRIDSSKVKKIYIDVFCSVYKVNKSYELKHSDPRLFILTIPYIITYAYNIDFFLLILKMIFRDF